MACCARGSLRFPQSRSAIWLLAFGIAATAGFDIEAHDAIGQTAASAMDQQAIKQIKRLLHGQDTSDVAGWGQQVEGTAGLHIQVHDDSTQPWCGPAAGRVAKCDDNICLLSAIKHFYGKVLEREGRKIDYPALDYDKVKLGLRFKDVDSLKMLINLLGDLHQPLHLGYASDDNGRRINLTFRGKSVSLYDFWDRTISETVRAEESNWWLGGWTHVRTVQADYDKDKAAWSEHGAFKMFERWAAESVQLACDEAYVLSGNKLGGPSQSADGQQVTNEAYQSWRSAWLRQVLLAGARTAIVLNDILDASSAAKLREGQAIQTKEDLAQEAQKKEWAKAREERLKQERRNAPFRGFNLRALTTNAAIASVVVTIFLFFVNYGFNLSEFVAAIQGISSRSVESGYDSRKARAAKRSQ